MQCQSQRQPLERSTRKKNNFKRSITKDQFFSVQYVSKHVLYVNIYSWSLFNECHILCDFLN